MHETGDKYTYNTHHLLDSLKKSMVNFLKEMIRQNPSQETQFLGLILGQIPKISTANIVSQVQVFLINTRVV